MLSFDTYIKMLRGSQRFCGDELDDFHAFLNHETDYHISPASRNYHGNYKGGLLEHSLNVTKNLINLNDVFEVVPTEICIFVGLFHDLGKVNTYKLNDKGKYEYEDKIFIDVPTQSIAMLSNYFLLTDQELQAIRYHDGQYVDYNKIVAMKECDLTLLLHFADVWAAKHEVTK